MGDLSPWVTPEMPVLPVHVTPSEAEALCGLQNMLATLGTSLRLPLAPGPRARELRCPQRLGWSEKGTQGTGCDPAARRGCCGRSSEFMPGPPRAVSWEHRPSAGLLFETNYKSGSDFQEKLKYTTSWMLATKKKKKKRKKHGPNRT